MKWETICDVNFTIFTIDYQTKMNQQIEIKQKYLRD